MLNFKKSLVFTVLFVVLLAIQNSVFAAGINMNLSREATVTSNRVTTDNTITSAAISSTVENVEDSHNSTFGINTVLDILLIAIGLVIILLAIAILIRLKR